MRKSRSINYVSAIESGPIQSALKTPSAVPGSKRLSLHRVLADQRSGFVSQQVGFVTTRTLYTPDEQYMVPEICTTNKQSLSRGNNASVFERTHCSNNNIWCPKYVQPTNNHCPEETMRQSLRGLTVVITLSLVDVYTSNHCALDH